MALKMLVIDIYIMTKIFIKHSLFFADMKYVESRGSKKMSLDVLRWSKFAIDFFDW